MRVIAKVTSGILLALFSLGTFLFAIFAARREPAAVPDGRGSADPKSSSPYDERPTVIIPIPRSQVESFMQTTEIVVDPALIKTPLEARGYSVSQSKSRYMESRFGKAK